MREKKEIRINIAIDGPSGVGKSYISKMLAKELNYKFISSGNLYRAIAYNALVNNLDLNDEKLISDSFESSDLDILDDDSIIFKNENITEKLRVNEVSDAASTIAKYQKVREKINHFIQQYSEANKGVIVDGRDATYRIFICELLLKLEQCVELDKIKN